MDDIKVMISTLPDADYVGGLDEVLASYKVEAVYAPKVSHTIKLTKIFYRLLKKREKLPIKTAKADVQVALKNKSFKAKFVGPVKEYGKKDLNNWSAVLHITYNKNNFLFTGYAETQSEKGMVAKKYISKVDVLKVGHHGLKDS